jgi:hypothetical protein
MALHAASAPSTAIGARKKVFICGEKVYSLRPQLFNRIDPGRFQDLDADGQQGKE